jgi:hypothetical protein
LVAIQAAVMPRLQVQRPVPERIAAFHAFAATDAQLLIDGVFKIGILDVRPLDRSRRAELAFRSCVSVLGSGLEITAAQVAIPAHGIGMDTFYSRMGQDTVDRTFFTLDTDVRVQLPDHLFGRRLAGQECCKSSDRQAHERVEAFPHKIPAFDPVLGRPFFHFGPLFWMEGF